MKNKLASIIFITLLMVVTACQSTSPKRPEPPSLCPVLQLQQSIPAKCCYTLCATGKFPESAYMRCQDKVFEKYSCNIDQKTVISFMMNSCRCK